MWYQDLAQFSTQLHLYFEDHFDDLSVELKNKFLEMTRDENLDILSARMIGFIRGAGRVRFEDGCLTAAQIKSRKPDFNILFLDETKVESEFKDWLVFLKENLSPSLLPFRQKFAKTGGHWISGELCIDEKGTLSLILIDSLIKHDAAREVTAEVFNDPNQTKHIYFALGRQGPGSECAIFVLDDIEHYFGSISQRHLFYLDENRSLLPYLEQHIQKTVKKKEVITYYCNLPLRLMRTMHSRTLLDIIEKSNENHIPINKKGLLPKEAYREDFISMSIVNKEQNQRLARQLKKIALHNYRYLLSRTPEQVEKEMSCFTLDSFKERFLESKFSMADINIADNNGDTLLSLAIKNDLSGLIQRLLEKGATIDIENKNIFFDLAIRQKDIGLIQFLVEQGMELKIYTQNQNDDTLLLLVIKEAIKKDRCPMNHEKILKFAQFLLEKGVNPNQTDQNGNTPISLAIHSEHLDFVRLLLKYKAEVNISNKDALLALAMKYMDMSIMQLLLKQGSVLEINAKNQNAETPLFLFIKTLDKDRFSINKNKILKFVQFFLECGADVNIMEKTDGNTPFSLAILNGLEDLAILLLENGAKINVINYDDKSPLFLAINQKLEKLAIHLVKKGADHKAEYSGKNTPLLLALRKELPDLAQILLEQGAEFNVKNRGGQTPLNLAQAKYPNLPLTKMLEDKQAALDIQQQGELSKDSAVVEAGMFQHAQSSSVKRILEPTRNRSRSM